MINGVSFGAISTDPTIKLQDSTIAQNQVGANPTASAAAEVKPDSYEHKSHKGLKALAGFAAIGTAIAGTVALAKKGKLPEAMNAKVLDLAQKAQAKAEAFKDLCLDTFKGLPEKLKQLKDELPVKAKLLKENLTKKAGDFKESFSDGGVKGFLSNIKDSVVNNFKSITSHFKKD